LVSNFLSNKVDEDFINYKDAIEIAEDWLFAAPKKLYGIEGII